MLLFVFFYSRIGHVIHDLQFTSTSIPVMFQIIMGKSQWMSCCYHNSSSIDSHMLCNPQSICTSSLHPWIGCKPTNTSTWLNNICNKTLWSLNKKWDIVQTTIGAHVRKYLTTSMEVVVVGFLGVWLSSTKLMSILSLGLGIVAPCPNSSIRNIKKTTNCFIDLGFKLQTPKLASNNPKVA